MKKIFLIIIVLATIICFVNNYRAWQQTDYFKIIFFDVGQGDAALIIAPGGQTILIDGGPDQKVLRGLGNILPFWYRRLDLVIITHAHDDHTTGLIEVLRRYQVKQVLYNNLDSKTPALTIIKKLFADQALKLTVAQAGTSFNFQESCNLNIIAASKESDLDENDYSIAVKFDCLDKSILLTGDAGVKIETELLAQNLNLQADIFKISHHGSTSANSEKFLRAIKPQAVVISVGENNRFNHPTSIILERLANLPLKVYRTDKQGDIEFLANKKEIMLIK